jgi:hypothetical protein
MKRYLLFAVLLLGGCASRHVAAVKPGHDAEHPALTPLGKATCKVGIEWLFNFGWPTPKNCKNEPPVREGQ